MPRFYPNVVTLAHDDAALAEQRSTIDILAKSNLSGRWAVKDSFNKLDLSRAGFDVLFEASWIRSEMPIGDASTDIEWRRESEAKGLPIDDADFALFTGRRGFRVVAGGMLYRSEGLVGLSNVVVEAADAVAVWRALILLSAQTFPRLPLVGYEFRRRACGGARRRLRDRRSAQGLGQGAGVSSAALTFIRTSVILTSLLASRRHRSMHRSSDNHPARSRPRRPVRPPPNLACVGKNQWPCRGTPNVVPVAVHATVASRGQGRKDQGRQWLAGFSGEAQRTRSRLPFSQPYADVAS